MNIWAKKIIELEAAGYSQVEICEVVGLSSGAMSDIKNGRTGQPRANAALKLLRMHEEKCADSRLAKPKRRAA